MVPAKDKPLHMISLFVLFLLLLLLSHIHIIKYALYLCNSVCGSFRVHITITNVFKWYMCVCVCAWWAWTIQDFYSMCKLWDAFQWHFSFHLALKRLENISGSVFSDVYLNSPSTLLRSSSIALINVDDMMVMLLCCVVGIVYTLHMHHARCTYPHTATPFISYKHLNQAPIMDWGAHFPFSTPECVCIFFISLLLSTRETILLMFCMWK